VAPVLQRFCVEVKQTLRFGMPAGTAPSTLLLDGPGAAIEHLPASVTDAIHMHVRLAPGLEPLARLEPFIEGSTERTKALSPTAGIHLVPAVALEYRAAQMLRRSLVGGTLIAGLLLASELAYTMHQERSLEPTFAAMAPRLAALTREEDMNARIQNIVKTTGEIAREVVTVSGPTPDWVAALALIASVADDHIVFDEIDGHAASPGSEIRLRGSCSGENDDAVSAVMSDMMKRFQSEPIVASVEQGSTNRQVAADGSVIRSFTVTLALRPSPMPHEALAAMAKTQAHEEGAQP
jgi:hypothetical protein